MATEKQRKHLSFKLSQLEEQTSQLHSAINDRVNKVLKLGRLWTEGKKEDDEGNPLNYREISNLVENTDILLAQQYEQLVGDDEDFPVNQTSTTDTTTSSTSHVTGAANQTSDTETLKSAMARIQIMEKAFSSLSDTVDKQKIDFDTLKDHMEGEMTQKLEDVVEKVVKHEKPAKRINKVEQRLGALEERETGNVEKLEAIEKKLAREKIKRENLEAVQNQREQKLEAVERKLDQMETSNISLSSKVEDQESSIQELTKAVETHSTSLETQTSTIQELTTTVERHSTSLETHTSSIQELTKTVETHFTSLENQTSSIQELTTTVERHSTTLDTDATKLTRVHNKVRVLKREKNIALKNVGKQLEEVTLNYKMVCKIVADRLVPLERLRGILNEKVKNSDDNVDKLYTVIQDVADLVPKVSHLENQIQQTITPTLAVMARAVDITPVKGNIIDKWERLAGNTGGPFDVNTGIFTVPVAGTYAVALWMMQKNEGQIVLCINITPSGWNPSVDNDDPVAGAVTDRDLSTNFHFCMVDMSVGDKFYVHVWSADESPTLGECRFSIFLIK